MTSESSIYESFILIAHLSPCNHCILYQLIPPSNIMRHPILITSVSTHKPPFPFSNLLIPSPNVAAGGRSTGLPYYRPLGTVFANCDEDCDYSPWTLHLAVKFIKFAVLTLEKNARYQLFQTPGCATFSEVVWSRICSKARLRLWKSSWLIIVWIRSLSHLAISFHPIHYLDFVQANSRRSCD